MNGPKHWVNPYAKIAHIRVKKLQNYLELCELCLVQLNSNFFHLNYIFTKQILKFTHYKAKLCDWTATFLFIDNPQFSHSQ